MKVASLRNNSLLTLLPLCILSFLLLQLDRQSGNERIAYEHYLIQQASEFRAAGNERLQGDPGLDEPATAAFHEYLMTMDPVEMRVPSERLYAAYQAMRQMNTKATNYQLTWTGTSSEMGGRTRAIMWDPNDATGKKVWAAGVTGGLWYNPNITSNLSLWQPVSDMWQNLVISCITYDPNNPMVFYVGTGEAQTALITYRESSGRGIGIWKTNDGGQTFSLLESTKDFAYVTRIAVRNESGNSVVYAGVVSGTYKGSAWQSMPSDGLYRSSDGGATWSQVLPNITGTNKPYAPADVQLGTDGRIYVGTMPNLDAEGGATILYSDLGTPGSWTEYTDIRTEIENDPVNNKPYRVVIATAPSNANIVYAAISAGVVSSTTNPVYKGYYLLKSVDKGNTWNQINTPDGGGDWANLAWHAMDLAVDPNDPSTVYAGGLDMWKTTNSGSTWSHLSDWSLMYYGGGDQYIHADQHIIAYKPGSSSTILFGTDGGVFYTSSGNSSSPVFEQKNKNYNTLQFYTCAMHPGAGQKNYLGGLQDNGTLLYSGSALSIFDMLSGGDGAFCFWDQDQGNIYITSYYYNRYYIYNNGTQYAFVDNQSGTFVNPADYSSPKNTLYANAVDYWGNKANQLLRVPNIPQNGNGSFVSLGTSTTAYFSAVRVSPYSTSSNTRLFVGTASGRLFKVENAQSEPQTTEIGSPAFPASNLSCIAVGGSEDTLLVTFSNYGVSSLWQTCNGGADWREVEGNLPDMPVRWAVYHPDNPNQMLIATELGVWSTSNLQYDNVFWQPQTAGMANVRVDMLVQRESDHTVLAATHGRGLFTTTFDYDITTQMPDKTEVVSRIYPTGTDHQLRIELDREPATAVKLRLISMDGRCMADLEKPSTSKRVDFQLPEYLNGVFIAEVKAGTWRITNRVVLY